MSDLANFAWAGWHAFPTAAHLCVTVSAFAEEEIKLRLLVVINMSLLQCPYYNSKQHMLGPN